MDHGQDYVIEMLHITKEFPGIKANDDITPVSYTHLDVYKRQVHGGMFLTMADCASGGAARSNGMRYVTVSNSFEFFRNTKDDHLIAEGWVKSRGTTICIVEVEIRDTSGNVLCGGTFTMFCVGKQDRLADD